MGKLASQRVNYFSYMRSSSIQARALRYSQLYARSNFNIDPENECM